MIDIELVREYGAFFASGLCMSLRIAFSSCCLGLFFGSIAGTILAGTSRVLRFLITIYVTVIRGTPMLIQITATYYLLRYAGVPISAVNSAILSIGLNSGAYVSQIVLSGINSVGKGQIEAAKVLGFTTLQIIWYIIFPQALRIVLPALGNEFVTLIKDSSLASIIGVYELTKQGEIVISQTYDLPTVYITIGLSYLTITTIISLLISYIEKKLNVYAHR